MIIERAFETVIATALILVVLFLYLWSVDGLAERVPLRWRGALRPAVWVAPAVSFLFVFQFIPLANSIILSFLDSSGTMFVGLDNFVGVLRERAMQVALRNSALWLVLLTGATVGIGLGMAVLTDRARFERVAKSFLFMPLAISFVAAAVIWRFMYDYRPPASPQTGTVNAVLGVVGGTPQPWLVDEGTNNAALIVAGVWMFTGFSLVVLSAAVKGLPSDLLEAARIDGANEWQLFRRVMVPLLMPTIAVVATATAIGALKAFDLVYIMTNGNFDTDVIATRMYRELFRSVDYGRASAIAVVMLIAVLPIMVLNLRAFRHQDSLR